MALIDNKWRSVGHTSIFGIVDDMHFGIVSAGRVTRSHNQEGKRESDRKREEQKRQNGKGGLRVWAEGGSRVSRIGKVPDSMASPCRQASEYIASRILSSAMSPSEPSSSLSGRQSKPTIPTSVLPVPILLHPSRLPTVTPGPERGEREKASFLLLHGCMAAWMREICGVSCRRMASRQVRVHAGV